MHMFSSDNKCSPRRELQGPRPAALRVGKDSFKIKKPQGRGQPPHPPPPPVIIHLKSPDIIHIKPQDFMNTVQQLTGKPSTSLASSTNSFSSSSSSSSLSSSSVLAPISVLDDKILDHLNLKKATDVEEDPERLDMRMQDGGSSGLSPSMFRSNISPMYAGAFLPSPNVYSDWLDFGPVY